MDQDIVIEVAKRTAREVGKQIINTPLVAAPFALLGVFAASWTGIIIAVLIILAVIAYDEYKEVINQIETSIKEAAFADQQPTETQTPASANTQAEADVTKVSDDAK